MSFVLHTYMIAKDGDIRNLLTHHEIDFSVKTHDNQKERAEFFDSVGLHGTERGLPIVVYNGMVVLSEYADLLRMIIKLRNN